MNVGYRINTQAQGDMIVSDLYDGPLDESVMDLRGKIMRQVLDTQDQQVREALVKLGWTPPAPDHPLAGANNPWGLDAREIVCLERYQGRGSCKPIARFLGVTPPSVQHRHTTARRKMGRIKLKEAVARWREFAARHATTKDNNP